MIHSGNYFTPGWIVLIVLGAVADMAHRNGGHQTRRERVIIVRE